MELSFKEIKRKIIPRLKQYNVLRAAIFDSFAKGQITEDSDIDILIEFKGQRSLFDLANLKIELEELLRRRVDLLTYNSLHPLLRKKILDEQEVIL